jgi:hypothetical protein
MRILNSVSLSLSLCDVVRNKGARHKTNKRQRQATTTNNNDTATQDKRDKRPPVTTDGSNKNKNVLCDNKARVSQQQHASDSDFHIFNEGHACREQRIVAQVPENVTFTVPLDFGMDGQHSRFCNDHVVVVEASNDTTIPRDLLEEEKETRRDTCGSLPYHNSKNGLVCVE